MDLHDAFDEFVRKYYEGFDYAATAKAHPTGSFKYDFKTLDKLHQDIVPKSSKRGTQDPKDPMAVTNQGDNADVNDVQ